MAKRKNATALFEVMAAHRARSATSSNGGTVTATAVAARHTSAPAPGQPYKASNKPGIFSLGRQWVATMLEKRLRPPAPATPTPAAAEALDAADPTAGITAHSLSARRSAASEPESVATSVAPTASTGPVTYTTVMPTYGRSSDGDESSARGPRNQVAFDRDKHQVTLRVRLNTAVISLVALLVVVGTAYIIGKRAGKPAGPAAAAAATPAPQPAPQKAPSTGGPLDVSPKPAKPPVRVPLADRSPIPGREGGIAQPSAPGGPGAGQMTPNAVFEDVPVENGAARRAIGLNYCVIQRFGPDRESVAAEVSAFLNEHGVPNTIEPGSKNTGTSADGCAIVGVRGFGKVFKQTKEYHDYLLAINRAAEAFPKKSSFNNPQTEMRKWME
jgi:hypothetical protein